MSDQKWKALQRAIRREIHATELLAERQTFSTIAIGLGYRATALRDALTIMWQVEDRLSRQSRTPRKAKP